MIKLIAPVVAPGKKKWEEKTKRRLLYNTVRLMKGCQYIFLEGILPFPTHLLLFSLLLLRFPKELISGTKQAENLFFQRDGLMQMVRLGVSYFERQLACLLEPLGQLTCTVKPYPERVATLPLHTSTPMSHPTRVCPELLFPLLSWNDIKLHTTTQNIRFRNWLKWKVVPFSLENYTEPVLTLQTHEHNHKWGSRNEHLQHSNVSHWLPSPLTNPLER